MSSEHLLLLGTGSDKIYSVIFDEKAKALRRAGETKTAELPNWVCQHPTIPEIVYFNSALEAKLFAATFDKDGKLTVVDEVSESEEKRPCHHAVLPDGSAVILANYGSGHVALVPLDSKGHFKSKTTDPSKAFMPLCVPVPGHARHNQARAHQIVIHGDKVIVPDLGSNKVWVLKRKGEEWVQEGFCGPFNVGDGPRHVAVHPNGKVIYVLLEMSSDLVVCTMPSPGQESQILSRQSIIPPEDKDTKMSAAEVLYLPPLSSSTTSSGSSSGKGLLICSNRQSEQPTGDALALFTVDPVDGSVSPAPTPYVRTGAWKPRGVAVDKTNRWICVAGEAKGGIVMFERVGEAELKEVARVEDMVGVNAPTWV